MARWTSPSGLKASSPVGVLRFSGVFFMLSFFFLEVEGEGGVREREGRKSSLSLFSFFPLSLSPPPFWKHQEQERKLEQQNTNLGEQHDRVDPFGPRFFNRPQQPRLPPQARDAGHRLDRDVVVSVVDEDGQEEVGRSQDRLGDGFSDGRGAAVAARAGGEVLLGFGGRG